MNKDEEIAQLKESLAAERESHEKELNVVEENWSAEVQKLREQLADERERADKAAARAELAQIEYPRFKCLICKKGANELASPYYLERVSATGKGAIALWLCTEHLNQQLAAEREQRYINGCTFAGPGRGDCEHFVGYPSPIHIPNAHDGPDDTVDAYNKPNGWCWSCWKSRQIQQLREQLAAEREKVKDLEQVWNALDENQQLKQQLAAERERLDWLLSYTGKWGYYRTRSDIDSQLEQWRGGKADAFDPHHSLTEPPLSQQLAAERETTQEVIKALRETLERTEKESTIFHQDKLRLIDERDALVDALKEARTFFNDREIMAERIDAALAKVEEAK